MKNKLDDDVDALFQLPMADFITARNALATRLKKAGRTDEANRVKAIAKPSIPVWTVNQLYWQHRDQFDRLISAGQRFRRAHTSRTSKRSELTEALDARREALTDLSHSAESLLRSAGHTPSMDVMRRIATTLEAISAYAALPDDQSPGRLTKDLDPPGFESLAPFIRAVATTSRPHESSRPAPSRQATASATKTRNNAKKEQTHQSTIAAAKTTLQNAKKSLADARAKVKALVAAQKKADAEVKNAENEKREAEQRFKEASAASANATVRAQNVAREAERAASELEATERAVQQAAKELAPL